MQVRALGVKERMEPLWDCSSTESVGWCVCECVCVCMSTCQKRAKRDKKHTDIGSANTYSDQ